MEIRKVETDKKRYLDFLLLADEQEDMVDRYLERGTMYVLEDDGVTPYTAHTTDLVPFYIVGANVKLRDGRLADIAPTMLDLMGLAKPKEMDGETLIVS